MIGMLATPHWILATLADRDVLPLTTFAGLSHYSFLPNLNDDAGIVPRIGFWVGPSDSKWKIGAALGQQLYHDGAEPLYSEFSLMLFDFFYPKKANYVLNLSMRFVKDKDTTFLWQFGIAF